MNEINEIARVNPFCVISKATYGQYNVHDIQTNSAWSSNPYGEDYATVPDHMVQDIMETNGFCDIVLNKDGTEVVSFTALEKPAPAPIPASELREQAYNSEAIIEWDNSTITVTQASQLWQYYAAEGSEKAEQLQALISEAKAIIRDKYHD